MPFEGDNMMGVKRNNRSAMLRILHEKGSMSRKRLAETMKLTPPAITKIVAEMLEEGLLREGCAVTSGSVGRREILVELNPHAFCALGVLLNLRQAILSATWLDGSVIFSEVIPLPVRAPRRRLWTLSQRGFRSSGGNTASGMSASSGSASRCAASRPQTAAA